MSNTFEEETDEVENAGIELAKMETLSLALYTVTGKDIHYQDIPVKTRLERSLKKFKVGPKFGLKFKNFYSEVQRMMIPKWSKWC